MERNGISDVQILRAVALLFFLAGAGLCPAAAQADGGLQFDVMEDTTFPGAAIFVATESFIHPAGNRLYDTRVFKIPPEIQKSAVAAFLCVTGESGKLKSDSTALISVPAKLAARYEKRSLETLYHDVFRFDPKNVKDGAVAVSRVLSDVVNPTGKFKYSMAAATVVIVYKKNDAKSRRVRFFTGLSNPTPGDIYAFSFDRRTEKESPVTLYFGGGHGIKGNATGNMMNGITLSGGDDWDGSGGILWDMDKYDLKKWSFEGTMTYKVSVDSVLNWIYPEILILEESEL